MNITPKIKLHIMIDGSQTDQVVLKASKLAIQRATGATVKELADEYGLSDAQMTKALEELGMIKKKEGTVEKVVEEKPSIYAEAIEKYSLTEEEIKEIITLSGYKLKELKGRTGSKKYTIINDLPKVD